MQEVIVVLAVVIPDEPPDSRTAIDDLRGRELPGVPGSWVTRVAVHRPHPSLVTSTPARAFSDPAPDDASPGGHDAVVQAAEATRASADHPSPTSGLTDDELAHELDLDYGSAFEDS